MLDWTRTRWGSGDLPVWQRLCAILPAGSPLLSPIAAANAAQLDAVSVSA